MGELDQNEQIVLEKVKALSKDGAPVEIALRDIKVEIPKKNWVMNISNKVASHTAVKDILIRLQKKGFVTLDYTGENKPKTKIIINHPNPWL